MPELIRHPEKPKAPFVMPDPDPASRRKEKTTALDSRLLTSGMTEGGGNDEVRGNDGEAMNESSSSWEHYMPLVQ